MFVVGLNLFDGLVCPLGWTKTPLSKRELKRVTKKFLKDKDVDYPVQLEYDRLYHTKNEMKKNLPEIV